MCAHNHTTVALRKAAKVLADARRLGLDTTRLESAMAVLTLHGLSKPTRHTCG